jgi:hypothetical protein
MSRAPRLNVSQDQPQCAIISTRFRNPTRKKMCTTHHSIHAREPDIEKRFVATTAEARPIVAMLPLS